MSESIIWNRGPFPIKRLFFTFAYLLYRQHNSQLIILRRFKSLWPLWCAICTWVSSSVLCGNRCRSQERLMIPATCSVMCKSWCLTSKRNCLLGFKRHKHIQANINSHVSLIPSIMNMVTVYSFRTLNNVNYIIFVELHIGEWSKASFKPLQ